MKIENYSKIASLLGKRGGQKTAQRGSNYYRQIGKKGLANRWKKAQECKKHTTGLDKRLLA